MSQPLTWSELGKWDFKSGDYTLTRYSGGREPKYNVRKNDVLIKLNPCPLDEAKAYCERHNGKQTEPS